MTRFRSLAAALLLCAPVCAPASADPLIPSPPMAPDVAALPRLAGDSAMAGYINKALDELDRRHFALVTCDAGTPDDPYRAVDTLSAGPEFLSFFITLGGFCDGAAHPFSDRQLVTFDLASGLRTDLTDLLPPDWSEPREAAAQLFTLYRKNLSPPLDDECLATFTHIVTEGYLTFDLGPDARSQRLVLLPVGLPYVAMTCDNEALVPPDQLRAAGFDPRLVEALTGSP
jgi:hypothetical protein